MTFREFAKENIVILDGAMGSLLQERGLKPGEAPESWNLTHPEEIVEVHRAYYNAGTNLIYCATFEVDGLKYSMPEMEELINAAIKNANKARELSNLDGAEQPKYIGLDITSLGRLLKPYGDYDFIDAIERFKEIVRIGKDSVDVIVIETMNDSYETKAAVLAAKEECDLPIIVTNAYGSDKKLMTGANAKAMIALLEGLGVDYFGANCSLGPDELEEVLDDMLSVSSTPLVFKPNAGLPKIVDGETVYDITPDEFARKVVDAAKKGARMLGGCCGTNPEYIKKISELVKKENLKPVQIEKKNLTVISSYTHALEIGKKPLLIGERINPTGKKKFKQALIDHDMNYIYQEGINQMDKGVHILDVNVGLPDIDEVKMMEEAVLGLQAIINLPLQIDTANCDAMERALRLVNGKALINSVNGKEESMRTVFPLAKKYGGAIICLTLDEKGIPETAEGRLEIAKKIVRTAEEYGISKNELIFDTLTLTISSDKDAAKTTLKALELIKNELGCSTSLGVSNVSFGLPNREAINAAFFTEALHSGLDLAIMNPYANDMLKSYYSYLALSGQDENCEAYINFIENLVENVSPVEKESKAVKGSEVGNKSTVEGLSELQYAITKGLMDKSGAISRQMIEDGADPLTLVENEIIPALDIVGIGFENKTVYLPQLLMSAEAAQAAFLVVKDALLKAEAQSGGNEESKNKHQKATVVIATVEGDIHDIGKNIAKLLLENYGFKVVDLGRDVKPELILEAVIKEKAPLVGLSALMTTTVPKMEETIKLIHDKCPEVKIVTGGAVLNQDYCDKIKSDCYAKDAMATVRFCNSQAE